MALNCFFIPFHDEFSDELEESENISQEEPQEEEPEEEPQEEEPEEEPQEEEPEEEPQEEESEEEPQEEESEEEPQEEEPVEEGEEYHNETVVSVSGNMVCPDYDNNSISVFLLASILGALLCICFFGRLKTL